MGEHGSRATVESPLAVSCFAHASRNDHRNVVKVGAAHFYTIPIKKWIKEGMVFKFWGDNGAKQRHVRDQGEMLHMFSLLVPKHISLIDTSPRCVRSQKLWCRMINETKHMDMLDIMAAMQDYLDEKCPFR